MNEKKVNSSYSYIHNQSFLIKIQWSSVLGRFLNLRSVS